MAVKKFHYLNIFWMEKKEEKKGKETSSTPR